MEFSTPNSGICQCEICHSDLVQDTQLDAMQVIEQKSRDSRVCSLPHFAKSELVSSHMLSSTPALLSAPMDASFLSFRTTPLL